MKVINKIKAFTPYAVAIGATVLMAEPSLAQDDGIQGWAADGGTGQGLFSAFMQILFWVAAIAGVLFTLLSIVMWALLGLDKAPQRMQEVGMKGVFIGLGAGACLLALSWVLSFVVGSLTGSGAEIEDEFQQLRGSSIYHPEALPNENSEAALYVQAVIQNQTDLV